MSVLILQPSGKITTKSTLAAAAAAADVAGKTVIVSSPLTLSSDLTWPTDRALNIVKGGMLTVLTGVTLTINGPFIAGMYQIFTGAGSVVFGTNSVQYQYPGWWAGYSSGFKAWNSENDGAGSGLDADVLHGYAPSLTSGVNKIPVTDNNGFIHATGLTTDNLVVDNIQTPALKFPATQVCSNDPNTLDDYEEGTFTPNLEPTSGSFGLSSFTGFYTKIGRMVNINIYINVSSASSPTGDLEITGLPTFSGMSSVPYTPVSIYADGLSSSATTALQGILDYVNTPPHIVINRYSAGVAYSAAAYFKAGSTLRVSVTFMFT